MDICIRFEISKVIFFFLLKIEIRKSDRNQYHVQFKPNSYRWFSEFLSLHNIDRTNNCTELLRTCYVCVRQRKIRKSLCSVSKSLKSLYYVSESEYTRGAFTYCKRWQMRLRQVNSHSKMLSNIMKNPKQGSGKWSHFKCAWLATSVKKTDVIRREETLRTKGVSESNSVAVSPIMWTGLLDLRPTTYSNIS